jgi:hypothetical protein
VRIAEDVRAPLLPLKDESGAEVDRLVDEWLESR